MWGYLLIAPMMIGFGIFFLFALGVSLGAELHPVGVISRPQWVGLGNYARLPRDPEFRTALRNTLRFGDSPRRATVDLLARYRASPSTRVSDSAPSTAPSSSCRW